MRRRIYKRDGWKCLCCGKNHDLSLDHCKPRDQGGSDQPSNLFTLCTTCNRFKANARNLSEWRHKLYEKFVAEGQPPEVASLRARDIYYKAKNALRRKLPKLDREVA